MHYLLYAYALIVLIGGIAGYASAKSMPSLIASVPSAILCALAAHLTKHNPTIGLGLGLAVSALLATFFVYRYAKTKKAMPAIPMIVLSDAVAIGCAFFLLGAMKTHH